MADQATRRDGKVEACTYRIVYGFDAQVCGVDDLRQVGAKRADADDMKGGRGAVSGPGAAAITGFQVA